MSPTETIDATAPATVARATGLSDAKRALLAQRLRGNAACPPANTVTASHADGPAPLSAAQGQLWYYCQVAPESPVYNELASIRKDGPFDLDAFRAAFNDVIARHDAWHATFSIVDGEPVSHDGPAHAFELPLVDLSGLAGPERERKLNELVAPLASAPYDLANGPLLRPLLVRLTPTHHRLYLALHHIIFDGVSLYRVILPELVASYDAACAGAPNPLSAPTVSYSDYARWEHAWAEGAEATARMEHWRRRLADAPMLGLPLDRPRPPRQQFNGTMEPLELDAELVSALRDLAAGAGATLFQVLASAFALLLARYSGQDDIVFATIADLRQRPELAKLVGYCLTPMVVRAELDGAETFLDVLKTVRHELVEGLTKLVPFERVVREVAPRRNPGVTPIYQAMVVLEPPQAVPDPSWGVRQMETAVGSAVGHTKLDFHLELDERPEGYISGRLIYNTDIFDTDLGPRAVGHLDTLLRAIVAGPGKPLSELPLLTPGERDRQLRAWNDTDAAIPDVTLHELVAANARRDPDAPAVTFEGATLSHGELDLRAERLAARLRAAGAAPGQVVAVMAERSLEMVVALLAVLKSGAAYLPLDPAQPADRLGHMLAESAAAVVLIGAELRERLPATTATMIVLDGAGAALPLGGARTGDTARGLDAAAHAVVPRPATADDLAYVIYTSGSTGRPKGVPIRHRSVVNLLTSMLAAPGLAPGDTGLAVTTYSFDMFVADLWLPLAAGARVVLASRAQAADGRRLAQLMQSERVTFMEATPATWQLLIDAGWEGVAELVAVTGGEAVKPALAQSLLGRCKQLWNFFGPTETTVWSTCTRLLPGDTVSVGRPIANTRVYVLDRNLEPVPVGVAGEICIGGAGVAGGYLHRPDLSAERFVADPFVPAATIYRTGDLGRFLADGRVEHLGRLDHQIKVRGYRIEPGEIEAALLTQPGVAEALVVAREDHAGDLRLVAYVVPAGAATESAVLRAGVRRQVPDYMVPSAFVTLDAFPLNANGKVDRAALPAPDLAGSRTGAPAPPRTELQARLAAIWAQSLGLPEVGVDDNFFELGGHSLLAVRMLTTVERELGVKLSVAELFASGMTVSGLAQAVVAQDGGPAETNLVVSLTTPSASHTLFFVNPGEASALTLRHLPAPLKPDFQVVGLLSARKRFDRTSSVEELAAPMLATIREKQASGPYYLAGYSLGAMLAYEIAGRLRDEGEDVGLLALLDAAPPTQVGASESMRGRLRRTMRRDLGETLRLADDFVRVRVSDLLIRLGVRRPAAGEFDVLGAIGLTRDYRGRAHDAPMQLFATDDSITHFGGGPSLGWDDVHDGPIHVRRVGGNHLSMVEQPNVSELAEALAESLRAARDDVEARDDAEALTA